MISVSTIMFSVGITQPISRCLQSVSVCLNLGNISVESLTVRMRILPVAVKIFDGVCCRNPTFLRGEITVDIWEHVSVISFFFIDIFKEKNVCKCSARLFIVIVGKKKCTSSVPMRFSVERDTTSACAGSGYRVPFEGTVYRGCIAVSPQMLLWTLTNHLTPDCKFLR